MPNCIQNKAKQKAGFLLEWRVVCQSKKQAKNRRLVWKKAVFGLESALRSHPSIDGHEKTARRRFVHFAAAHPTKRRPELLPIQSGRFA
jgi:hypothetical protein